MVDGFTQEITDTLTKPGDPVIHNVRERVKYLNFSKNNYKQLSGVQKLKLKKAEAIIKKGL